MIKAVVAAVYPGIIGDFAIKNQHLCIKVDAPIEGLGWSTTINHLLESNRLVIVPTTDDVIGTMVSTGQKFVLVYPMLGKYGVDDPTYAMFESLSDAGHCELIAIKEQEDFYSAVSLWEDIFFPTEPAQALLSPNDRAGWAWKALKTFPASIKESMDIQAVAEYAVELADQMAIELNRPKIQY
jgi:hypothetical protein